MQRHHTYKIAVSNYSKNTSKSKSSKGDIKFEKNKSLKLLAVIIFEIA